jgi:histidinol-phosphate aminotransferase
MLAPSISPPTSNIAAAITPLVRPGILRLKPYSSARDEFKGQADVFLDANENSLGSPLNEDFSRYPDPQQKELKGALADLKGVSPSQIFLGNGSDEAIDLLLRVFCQPDDDHIILLPPTYGMYSVQANIHGCGIKAIPLHPDFTPDIPAILAAANTHSKILFLCSPNNPTGNSIEAGDLETLLSHFPGIVAIDEAYIDFSRHPSTVGLLERFPRLVVLQTLSKAWGLAALRVGMAFASPFIIDLLNKVKYPYNLSIANIRLALQALSHPERVQEKVAVLLAERSRLKAALPELPCIRQIYPSDANFLLVRTTDANRIYRQLSEKGIIVRNRTNEMHCGNCLRITVGTPSENTALLEALQAC